MLTRPDHTRHIAGARTHTHTQMIDPKHLEKDLGGTSTWRYVFKEAVEGENKHMEDAETKEKRIADYKAAYTAFEASTKKWISGDEEAKKTRRAKDAKILEIRRLDMDPYIRGQTVFTRDGTVVGDGQIKWHYDHGRSEEWVRMDANGSVVHCRRR